MVNSLDSVLIQTCPVYSAPNPHILKVLCCPHVVTLTVTSVMTLRIGIIFAFVWVFCFITIPISSYLCSRTYTCNQCSENINTKQSKPFSFRCY